MKGFITISIPTKKYIKAYIIHKMGHLPVMNNDSVIGSKLYDLLQHSTNEEFARLENKRYDTEVSIRISMHTFRKRGHCLNHTNVKNFNNFVEHLVKNHFYTIMDRDIDVLPSFDANLPNVREMLGIDIESWSDDSMKKDYYRYRIATKKPLLYNKSFSATVPSEKSADIAF